jgi:single-strand DNA-binding protein
MTTLTDAEHAPLQFQVIQLTGRLTNKPELRSTEKGSVVTLRIAVQRRRGKHGQDRGAEFIEVTAFGSQAENCAEYLTKGRRVEIVGRLHHSEWDSDDGRRQKPEVIADNVDFLDGPRGDTAETPAVEAAA